MHVYIQYTYIGNFEFTNRFEINIILRKTFNSNTYSPLYKIQIR